MMSPSPKLRLPLVLSVILAVTVLGLVPAWAEPLDLASCLRTALDRSLSVRQAEAEVAAAEFRLKEAKSAFLPTLATTYSYTRLDEAPTTTFAGQTFELGTANNFSWALNLTQPLFTGFRVLTAKKLAELGLSSQKLGVDLARLDLARNVKNVYFGVLLAQKNQWVAEETVKSLRAQVEDSKNFFEVGMIPKNDLLEAEVELANAEQLLVQAKNQVNLAKAQLNTLLRQDVNTDLELVDVLDYVPAEPDFAPSLDQALAARPELKQAQLGVDAATENVTLAKADYYPSVSLVGSYSRSGDGPELDGSDIETDPDQFSLTVGLSWTIWDWKARDYRIGVSKSQVMRTRHVLNEVRDGVTLEVKQALLNLATTRQNIGVNRKAVEQAEESLRMSRERYKEQVATSTEVLLAQTRLSQTQVNFFAALYGYHLAEAELARAMGRM